MEYFKLNNTFRIPKVGMGTNTFGKENNQYDGALNMDIEPYKLAYKNGYRLFDTAKGYRNEKVLHAFIKQEKINRSELIIQTKISYKNVDINDEYKVKEMIEESINYFLGYVDVYFIHHPSTDEENLILWKYLIEYYKTGHIKALGVSNFSVEQINYLIENTGFKPQINQIVSNNSNWNHSLIFDLQKMDILPQAWSPLHVDEAYISMIEPIASKYKKTWAQVLLKAQISRYVSVIPKSHNNLRQQENIDIFDFQLTHEEINTILNIINK